MEFVDKKFDEFFLRVLSKQIAGWERRISTMITITGLCSQITHYVTSGIKGIMETISQFFNKETVPPKETPPEPPPSTLNLFWNFDEEEKQALVNIGQIILEDLMDNRLLACGVVTFQHYIIDVLQGILYQSCLDWMKEIKIQGKELLQNGNSTDDSDSVRVQDKENEWREEKTCKKHKNLMHWLKDYKLPLHNLYLCLAERMVKSLSKQHIIVPIPSSPKYQTTYASFLKDQLFNPYKQIEKNESLEKDPDLENAISQLEQYVFTSTRSSLGRFCFLIEDQSLIDKGKNFFIPLLKKTCDQIKNTDTLLALRKRFIRRLEYASPFSFMREEGNQEEVLRQLDKIGALHPIFKGITNPEERKEKAKAQYHVFFRNLIKTILLPSPTDSTTSPLQDSMEGILLIDSAATYLADIVSNTCETFFSNGIAQLLRQMIICENYIFSIDGFLEIIKNWWNNNSKINEDAVIPLGPLDKLERVVFLRIAKIVLGDIVEHGLISKALINEGIVWNRMELELKLANFLTPFWDSGKNWLAIDFLREEVLKLVGRIPKEDRVNSDENTKDTLSNEVEKLEKRIKRRKEKTIKLEEMLSIEERFAENVSARKFKNWPSTYPCVFRNLFLWLFQEMLFTLFPQVEKICSLESGIPKPKKDFFKCHIGNTLVKVKIGNILDEKVDAIVCPFNNNLQATEGLAFEIAQRGGRSIQKALKNQKVEIGNAICTEAGDLSGICASIIHVAVPDSGQSKEKG